MAPVKQTRVLKKCPEIVVATPGRLWELLEQVRTFRLDYVRHFNIIILSLDLLFIHFWNPSGIWIPKCDLLFIKSTAFLTSVWKGVTSVLYHVKHYFHTWNWYLIYVSLEHVYKEPTFINKKNNLLFVLELMKLTVEILIVITQNLVHPAMLVLLAESCPLLTLILSNHFQASVTPSIWNSDLTMIFIHFLSLKNIYSPAKWFRS